MARFDSLNQALTAEGFGPVVQFAGRWFITIGHAGFNLPANNRDGWATRAAAAKAHRHCLGGKPDRREGWLQTPFGLSPVIE